ncbi:MAG: hypothetical protein NC299_16810, partial [Lachnospiraceae bacterium]|nr:hypothetical protein [Lachnospiraceae bacterium]
MAEDLGIKLAVSVADLLESVNRALDGVNKSPELAKLKVGIDTSAWNGAIKKLKSDLSSVSVKVDASKINLGGSVGLDDKSLKSAVKSQTSELDTLVTGYMKKFDIVKKTADTTAEEIRAKFTAAISNVLNAKSIGDKDGIANAFQELISLSKEFGRTASDRNAVKAFEDYKASLNGIIPISREVKNEFKSLMGNLSVVRDFFNKSFGENNWAYTVDAGGRALGSTDVFLSNLGIPGFDEIYHAADGITKLAEAMGQLRANALNRVSLFDIGEHTPEEVMSFINNYETLNNIRKQEAETANAAAQAEKQAAASLQSIAEVNEKLKSAMTPVLGDDAGKYASEMMSAVEPYKNVINALGQALDRLSSSKSVDISSELSALNDSLNIFKEGISSPQGLVNELNSFAAAERKSVEAINSERNALDSLSAVIDKVNKKRNETNKSSKDSDKAKNVGIGVNADSLIKSLNTAIRDINKNSTDSLTKVKLSANTVSLRSSLRNAVNEINKGGSLDTAPVKLSVAFKNVKKTIAELQKQINGSTVSIGNLAAKGANVGAAVGDNAQSAAAGVTEELKNQAAAQGDAANAAKESAQSVVQSENAAKQAVAELNTELEKQNELRRISKKTSAVTGDVTVDKTYGTSYGSTTVRTVNGKENQTTVVQNFAAQAEMLARANAEADKLKTNVAGIVDKAKDLNDSNAIKNPLNLEVLNEQAKKVESAIEKLRGASKETFTSMKSDANVEIEKLKQLIGAFQKAEHSATTFTSKHVDVLKPLYSAKLDEFAAKIGGTGAFSAVKDEIEQLKVLLGSVTDSASFNEFYNQFDILKAKVKAVNAEMKSVADTSSHIDDGLKSLDKISGDNFLAKNSALNQTKYNEMIASVDAIRDKYVALQDSLKKDGSAENLAKVREQVTAIDEELKKVVNDAEILKQDFKSSRDLDTMNKKVAQAHALITKLQDSNAVAMNKVNTASGSGLTFGEELRQLNEQLQRSPQLVDSVIAKTRTLEAQMKQLGYTGNTLLGEMKEKALKFIKWTGMTLLITKARMYFRQLFTTVYELDTALVDLRKTFGGTDEELNQFYLDANKLAKQLGVTTKEIIEQGAAFSRLGYN